MEAELQNHLRDKQQQQIAGEVNKLKVVNNSPPPPRTAMENSVVNNNNNNMISRLNGDEDKTVSAKLKQFL